jgi:hypothetical protein
MPNVDVVTETVIGRDVLDVSQFAGDPGNAPAWYENIKKVEWLTPPPLHVGSHIQFMAEFLGKKLNYTYEIVALEAGRKLVMRTAEGPFPMETTYEWEGVGPGVTRMKLRNRGTPSGFGRLMAPFLSLAMRRANTKDLRRLKELLEARSV